MILSVKDERFEMKDAIQFTKDDDSTIYNNC